MALLGGADQVVIGNAHRVAHGPEIGRDPVGEGLRIHAGVGGGLLHLLPVLIGAGQEEDVVTVQPLEPRHHVSSDGGIGMADMRRAIHVVDRRGDSEALGHGPP